MCEKVRSSQVQSQTFACACMLIPQMHNTDYMCNGLETKWCHKPVHYNEQLFPLLIPCVFILWVTSTVHEAMKCSIEMKDYFTNYFKILYWVATYLEQVSWLIVTLWGCYSLTFRKDSSVSNPLATYVHV